MSDRKLLAFRAGPREQSGPTSSAGPVWPEQVLSVRRTRAFHSRKDHPGGPVITNGKRPKISQCPESPFSDFLKLIVAK